MKRCPTLLLAATLFLCSFKSDVPDRVSQTNQSIDLVTSYTWHEKMQCSAQNTGLFFESPD